MIIINGDDFGMNRRCSTAIAAAFDKGLITDTTMMANGDCFEYAVALAREKGFFDRIGIHFNLTEGTPLTKGITELRTEARPDEAALKAAIEKTGYKVLACETVEA